MQSLTAVFVDSEKPKQHTRQERACTYIGQCARTSDSVHVRSISIVDDSIRWLNRCNLRKNHYRQQLNTIQSRKGNKIRANRTKQK